MPGVELLNVPKESDKLPSYLMNNFRRIADVLAIVASKRGSEDIEFTTSTTGIILTSPNGTRYRVTANNDGTLAITAV